MDPLFQEDVGNDFALLYRITGSLVSRALCTHTERSEVEMKMFLQILLVPVVITILCTQVLTKFVNFFFFLIPIILRGCEFEGSLGPVASSRPPCTTNDTQCQKKKTNQPQSSKLEKDKTDLSLESIFTCLCFSHPGFK